MIGIVADIHCLGVCGYFKWRCSTLFFEHMKVLIAVLKAVSQSVKEAILPGCGR